MYKLGASIEGPTIALGNTCFFYPFQVGSYKIELPGKFAKPDRYWGSEERLRYAEEALGEM